MGLDIPTGWADNAPYQPERSPDGWWGFPNRRVWNRCWRLSKREAAGTVPLKGKPAGVMGAEIWVKIGPTPPVDPSELTFLSVDTRTPYTTDFDGADGGKQAHYMLRWVNTRGETGPWSETATATIGA